MDYLPPLFTFAAILVLTSHSYGQRWKLDVKQHYKGSKGDAVTIPCTFTYPVEHHMNNPQLFWKLFGEKSTFNTYDKDLNAFIYHPNSTFVEERYRGKTRLVQNNSRSCTLKIAKLMDEELKIYFRIIAKGNNYSFIRESVTISQTGLADIQVALNTGPVVPTSANLLQDERKRNGLQTIFIAIFVPLAAVLMITVGFVIWNKQRRSQSLVRDESGYYANFSRASPSKDTRDKKKEDSKSLPDKKIVDEPVYINVQRAVAHTDTSTAFGMDNKDNIYENVHLSK
ncbi:uncharacterized protein LOC144199765 [Stigmatopora nigra]